MKSNRSTGDDRPGGETETAYSVLGGGHIGTAVARRLRAAGHTVCLVDELYDPSDMSGVRGSPTDIRVLEEAGLASASTVIVATQSDRRNLLIAQNVRAHFAVSRILVLVNSPPRLNVFADAGHDPVCATSALSDALVNSI